ncbi:MAG: zinc finger HIT domain-containing protein [Haloferacaceae archaeon]
MSTIGVCQICENAEGRYTCAACGSLVCPAHYVEDRGVCTDCAGAPGRGGAPGGVDRS